MNRANCYQPQFAWHWNALIVLLLAIPLLKSGFTNHTFETRQEHAANAALAGNMMACADAAPITRWDRLTAAQRYALNDNDPMTNATGLNTGFHNALGNPILVDNSVAGAPKAVNSTDFNNPFPDAWMATSSYNSAQGNTGFGSNALLVNQPELRTAMNIAGVKTATSHTQGNFDVIAEVVVQNTGNVDLDNLHLIANISAPSQLGSAFVAVVQAPHIVPVGAHGTMTNAATNPAANASFNGAANNDLLTGGGLLHPGEAFVVQFRYEVNPHAPGAPAFLKTQVEGSGQGLDMSGTTMTVSDLSDAGYEPQTNNTGWPGDSGGSNDPTPLTNCYNLLNNSTTCNNSVQVSLNQDCIASIYPAMILEGEPAACVNDDLLPLGAYYQITMVTTLSGLLIPDMVPSTPNIYEVDGSYVGQTLIVKVMDIVYSNPCWGYATLEDKLGPVFDCTQPLVVNCNVALNSIPAPVAVDNCDPNPVVSFLGQTVVDNNICNDGIYRVVRTYTAHDNKGNPSLTNCVQEVQLVRPPVDFPDDIVWSCNQYGNFPAILNAAPLNPLVVDTDPVANGINVSPTLPDAVLANTGSGVVNNMGGVCNYVITWEDDTIQTCGNTLKIIRSWSVIDWCNGAVITVGTDGEDNVQVIKVMDMTPPTISKDPFNISASIPGQHPQYCRSQGFLPPPVVSDGCGSVSIQIITEIGEAVYINGNPALGGFVPPPGLPIGVHNVVYKAIDACDNETSINVPVTVVDDITPTAVCDEWTVVNLSSTGSGSVDASTFDDGSHDNCCIDHFEVRRMNDPCNDNHNDLLFGPSVVFCCADVGAGPQMVVFRVYDCHGNFNDCMVQVTVHDKIAPVVTSCPSQSQRITCDEYAADYQIQLNNLAPNQTAQNEFLDAQFGKPTFYDNCGFTVTKTFARNIDQCLEGAMTRTWLATDPGGLQSQLCTQTIFVDHVSDWVVEFAPDVTVNCGMAPPNFVEPEIFFNDCEMIAVSYVDEIYTTVVGACFKVIRTWKIINWCVVGEEVENAQNQEVKEAPENALGLPFPLCDLDGDGDCDGRTFRDSWNATSKPGAAQATQSTNPDTDPDSDPWDGQISYQQVIKVIDSTNPVFTAGCPAVTVGIFDTICATTVVLDTPDVSDCSPIISITANGDLGTGFGPFTNVPPGVYQVTFTAMDHCNNQSNCSTTVTVVDSLAPTIKCQGITLVITDSMMPFVDLNAMELDAGSEDNCSEVTFSFSPNDLTDSVKIFDCNDIPFDSVNVYVTDTSGNQDFCRVQVTVQDNNNNCFDDGGLVAQLGGSLGTEDGEGVEEVQVNLSGQSSNSMMSNGNGSYMFYDIPLGNDVTVTPIKDNDHLNGVTTFDLVLISKHILGISNLNSPYKLIAADANKSNTVTTFDLVEIRKLILMINPAFPNNTSWRFVAKDYVFPNPANPFLQNFPEAINVNDIPADVLDAGFVAVKIGDVNGSATPHFAAGNKDRTTIGSLVFTTDDVEMEAGESRTIAFNCPDFEVEGFQFTLNFDKNALELTEVGPALAGQENFGLALLNQGAITASWNGSATPGAGEPVFQLAFTAKQKVKLSDAIHLNSRFTKAEAYLRSGELLDVQLDFNHEIATTAGFELYQNVPNPFSEYTAIGFNLPSPTAAELTITDVSGKVVKTVMGHFTKGYNEIRLSRLDLPTTGILYYRLDTPSGSATKMMLFMN
ncbi:MAG: T9SS type A sorting domain-containing protein [Lewinellaceae bacterium]|nr:T9SS type A sorting domain-containing protein [Saprospiraceae bacterium]MCB9341356.1 T9SS type A sorting domain-containing protein [Lewinellaceae bacterium]